MNQPFHHIQSAVRHDLKLALATPVSEQLLLGLIALVERGVAVTLILNSKHNYHLREQLFLFNKCLILLKKGGLIYVHPPHEVDLMIGDYRHSLQISNGSQIEAEGPQDTLVLQHLKEFKSLEREAVPFLKSEGDIQIHFEVTDDIILKGDPVTLSWQVNHADTVAIEGIGGVESVGRYTLNPRGDTIFKIGAYNSQQSALRTLAVKVYDNIDLEYDLSFANVRTNDFHSLVKAENQPHVFGVAKGNVVRFKWQVKDSNEVRVSPFNLEGTSGEHQFVSEANMTITIEAMILQRKVSRKIQLLVFPIKLFSEKLVRPLEGLTSETDLSHKRQKILKEVNSLKHTTAPELKAIKKKELERYRTMVEKIRSIGADTSAGTFDLDGINLKVLERLQKFYAKEPKMVDVLESVKSLYGKD